MANLETNERPVAEGADPVGFVQRVEVGVDDRRVVDVDPHRPQLFAGDPRRPPRQLHVAGRAQRHVAGEDRRRGADPRHLTLLLVGVDQHRHPRVLVAGEPLDPVREAGDLGRVFELVGPVEVDDAAGLELVDQLGDVLDAVEAAVEADRFRAAVVQAGAEAVDHEELADLLLQRHPRQRLPDPLAFAALAGREGGRRREQRDEQRAGRGRSHTARLTNNRPRSTREPKSTAILARPADCSRSEPLEQSWPGKKPTRASGSTSSCSS